MIQTGKQVSDFIHVRLVEGILDAKHYSMAEIVNGY